MTHAPVPPSFRSIFVTCVISLFFAVMAPAAFAQSHGGGHASASAAHASSSGAHFGGGRAASGGTRGSTGRSSVSYARFGGGGSSSGASSSTGSGAVAPSEHSSGTHSSARWPIFESAEMPAPAGGAARRGAGPPAAPNARFTQMIFEAPATSISPATSVLQGAHIITLGTQRPQVILNGTGPVRYELVNTRPFAADNYLWQEPPGQGEHAGAVGATLGSPGRGEPRPYEDAQQQQARPAYVPPRPAQNPRPAPMPQAPRPILVPPMQGPRPAGPVFVPPPLSNNPMHGPQPMQFPAQPIRLPAQSPIIYHPIPMTHPIPVSHFPVQRPIRPEFHPIVPMPKAPLFRPVIASRPLALGMEAPPLRRLFDANRRVGGPFAVMGVTPTPARTLQFEAHPCFQTIGNCGLGLGGFAFDGDFDFDDGFPFGFGFGFGSPFFPGFGPFGFPAFGFGFGPNCFFDGVFEPCAFTPWGFAQFQAFAPGGWGWSYLGLGNGWFYSPPEQPPAPPWNAIETAPLNLQSQNFTGEYYMPAPAPLPLPYSEPQAGTQQNPVTEIVTTDGVVFGVTSYWMDNNQLCYVTTYNVKHCIPMSRVDLQKTVDMNYNRGVNFTLTPEPPKKSSDE